MSTPDLPDTDLERWLKEQLQRIKGLEAEGRLLKLNFVQNAREKGDLLIAVEQRLHGSPLSFRQWVVRDLDIGYSTALLWMDVALNFDVVKEQFADSNPLELSIRVIRDAIRDHRQAQGGGKPGSGRKAAEKEPVDDTSAGSPTGNELPEELDVKGVVPTAGDTEDTNRWEREVAKAEAEAAEFGDDGSVVPTASTYKITIMVLSDAEQPAVQLALAQWKPTSKSLGGSKKLRTYVAHIPPTDMAELGINLGKLLKGERAKKLQVSITQ